MRPAELPAHSRAWIGQRLGRSVTVGANGVPREQGKRLHLDLRVPATPESLAEVRRSLETLAIPPELLDDAKLIVTELVGNSIRHSGLKRDEQVRITANWSRASLRVVVRDRPHPLAQASVAGTIRPAPEAESGWGLYIVDRLASRWGTTENGHWFELDWTRSRTYPR